MANNEILVPIEPIGKINNLRIYVSHCKGGFNVFHGTQEERGVFVFLIPVEYVNGIYSQMICQDPLHSGFKVLAKPTGRRNAKAEEKVWNAIKGHTDEIAKMFRASKFTEVCDLIVSLTKGI